MLGSDLALAVSPRESAVAAGGRGRKRFRVAAIDYGMKRNIVRLLQAGSCRVAIFPATASELPEAESPDAHRIAATAKARRPEVREFIVDSFSNAFRSAGFEREIPIGFVLIGSLRSGVLHRHLLSF